ncbi:hypothetical protein H5410_003272 [Solanum commersonii]|uniref:Uncharacterized protein n=1 Tax=Solanum commersonii TaxID=4109 RepID=A0A9J6B4L0_SOLCO|nr:hypothetical protein H5410_003272 [Solanum commersonii]
MIAEKGQTKQRLFQSGESIQEKGIKLPMNNSRFQAVKGGSRSDQPPKINSKDTNEHDIHDLPNCKQVKRKSFILTNSPDQFQNNQGIRIDDETKRDNHTIADVEFMHVPIINEQNK